MEVTARGAVGAGVALKFDQLLPYPADGCRSGRFPTMQRSHPAARKAAHFEWVLEEVRPKPRWTHANHFGCPKPARQRDSGCPPMKFTRRTPVDHLEPIAIADGPPQWSWCGFRLLLGSAVPTIRPPASIATPLSCSCVGDFSSKEGCKLHPGAYRSGAQSGSTPGLSRSALVRKKQRTG